MKTGAGLDPACTMYISNSRARRPSPRIYCPRVYQSVLLEFLDVDWKTEQFAELLFGDYLNREDKVCATGVATVGGEI